MIQKLAKLHHHVSVASVWTVLFWVISLRHPSWIGQHSGQLTASWFLDTVLKGEMVQRGGQGEKYSFAFRPKPKMWSLCGAADYLLGELSTEQ